MRKLHLASLTAALVALSSGPLAAQSQVAPTPATKAGTSKVASRDVIGALSLASAVSACELAINSKVPLQTGVISAAQAATFAITNLYNNQIEGISTSLKPEQIMTGNVIETIVRIKDGCYTKLNDTDKKYVDSIINEVQAQVKKQGGTK